MLFSKRDENIAENWCLIKEFKLNEGRMYEQFLIATNFSVKSEKLIKNHQTIIKCHLISFVSLLCAWNLCKQFIYLWNWRQTFASNLWDQFRLSQIPKITQDQRFSGKSSQFVYLIVKLKVPLRLWLFIQLINSGDERKVRIWSRYEILDWNFFDILEFLNELVSCIWFMFRGQSYMMSISVLLKSAQIFVWKS